MSRYDGVGCKGGTSATAGKKADVLSVEVNGRLFTKMAYLGQRALFVGVAEKGYFFVDVSKDVDSAIWCAKSCLRQGWQWTVGIAVEPGVVAQVTIPEGIAVKFPEPVVPKTRKPRKTKAEKEAIGAARLEHDLRILACNVPRPRT